MSPPWVGRISRARADALVPLRHVLPLEILEVDSDLWVILPHPSEAADRALAGAPFDERFQLSDDGRLTPIGKRTPTRRLPDGERVPLERWMRPEPAPAAYAGAAPEGAAIELVRTSVVAKTRLLVTTSAIWSAWATSAPMARLAPLAFAMADDGRVAIRGEPLPPIPGEGYPESQGVAAPIGFAWRPAVDAGALRAWLELEVGDVALLHRDGSTEIIPGDAFVRASRAAVRASLVPPAEAPHD